jgi:hypothetical protein
MGFYCEDGADIDGGSCSEDTYTEEMRSCSADWTLINPEQCRQDPPADYVGVCQDEWTPIINQCEKLMDDVVTYYCTSTEYELDVSQCKRTLVEELQVACGETERESQGVCFIKEISPVNRVCDAPYAKTSTFECRYYVEINDFDNL